jgi:hypothetical protein
MLFNCHLAFHLAGTNGPSLPHFPSPPFHLAPSFSPFAVSKLPYPLEDRLGM